MQVDWIHCCIAPTQVEVGCVKCVDESNPCYQLPSNFRFHYLVPVYFAFTAILHSSLCQKIALGISIISLECAKVVLTPS